MTPRQKEVFDFIQSYISNRGFTPTYAEIMEAANIGRKSYLHWLLKNLEEQGKITITPYKARGLSINNETIREKHTIKTLKKQLEIAKKALYAYAYQTIKETETDEDGKEYDIEYPYSNDDGEVAKTALKQIEELKK